MASPKLLLLTCALTCFWASAQKPQEQLSSCYSAVSKASLQSIQQDLPNILCCAVKPFKKCVEDIKGLNAEDMKEAHEYFKQLMSGCYMLTWYRPVPCILPLAEENKD